MVELLILFIRHIISMLYVYDHNEIYFIGFVCSTFDHSYLQN